MFKDQEAAIVARLRERLASDIAVQTAAQVADAVTLRQQAPCAVVTFNGYTAGESTGNGRVQAISMDWLVLCCARNASQGGASVAARNDAADVAAAALAALLGYPVMPAVTLRLADAPPPEYLDGYVYIPIAFTSRATFKGDNQ